LAKSPPRAEQFKANLIVPYVPEVFISEKAPACSIRAVNSPD
jgi:hypothetical protein